METLRRDGEEGQVVTTGIGWRGKSLLYNSTAGRIVEVSPPSFKPGVIASMKQTQISIMNIKITFSILPQEVNPQSQKTKTTK